MKKNQQELKKCRLCGCQFPDSEMSEEHYPAKNTGNDDIVGVNLVKAIDIFLNYKKMKSISDRISNGESIAEIVDDLFDNELSISIFPNGRTARTLCRKCNTFLGNYDEAYLKFYEKNGEPSAIKGFQPSTKIKIIKAIFAKFLSIPEAINEEFDFLDFINDEKCNHYQGKWNLYFIKRDNSTDIFGFGDIQTGKLEYDKGTVYELSDQKFIYNLINFPLFENMKMTNIFDILKKNYTLTKGSESKNRFHDQIFMHNMFKNSGLEDDDEKTEKNSA